MLLIVPVGDLLAAWASGVRAPEELALHVVFIVVLAGCTVLLRPGRRGRVPD